VGRKKGRGRRGEKCGLWSGAERGGPLKGENKEKRWEGEGTSKVWLFSGILIWENETKILIRGLFLGGFFKKANFV